MRAASYAWAGPGNENVTQQAIQLSDSRDVANVMYWTLLCRQPSEQEIQIVTDQLANASDLRNQIIQEMVWGILVSAEFRFCN